MDKIKMLEEQLNEWSAKADSAEDAGLDNAKNMAKWERYFHRYAGFIKALRILGYDIDWDADNGRFVIKEGNSNE